MINVTVSGKAGTGKSTIALLITELLVKEGFNIENLDLIDEMRPTWFAMNDVRLGYLKAEDTVINIKEQQENSNE